MHIRENGDHAEQHLATKIFKWLREDSPRFEALQLAQTLELPDWCIGAGFVRNLVWDKIFNTEPHTLNDLDLIYFDSENIQEKQDRQFEHLLLGQSKHPWSVKNQARMHLRNQDRPYQNTAHAMSHWVEVETAIGTRLVDNHLELIAPFGLSALMAGTITLNPKRPKPNDFKKRVREKNWQQHWPGLQIADTISDA